MSEPSPLLRVVAGGEPRDDELAALVTALAVASASRAVAEEPAAASRWRAGAIPGQTWGRTGWTAAARHSALRRPL